MSREVQLADSGRQTDPFAYCRVPSTTPRQTGRTSGFANSNPQVPSWTTDSAKGRQTRSYPKDACGTRLAVIEPTTDDALEQSGRPRCSFSRNAERLLTHDHGVLRVWETKDFSELCRRRLHSDRRVIATSFCDGSAVLFIVFFDDFSESVFSIDEDQTSNAWSIRQGWDRSAHPPLPGGWSLSNAERIRLISDDEKQRIFVSCAEVNGLGLVLSVRTGEERAWKMLSFAEHFGPEFVFRRAQCGGDALLVIGREQRTSGSANCMALFCGISSGETEFVSLEGDDGRLTRDGTAAVTWDAPESVESETARRGVCVYNIEKDSDSDRRSVASRSASPAKPDPCFYVSLDEVNVLADATVVDANVLLRGKRATYGSSQLSTEDLFPCTRLAMFCDVPSSGGAKIVLMDLERHEIEWQIDISASCLRSATPLTEGDGPWCRNFDISEDEQQLFLCDVDKGQGVVYSFVDGKELCKMDRGDIGDLTHASMVKFDPLGRVVAVEIEKRIQIFAASPSTAPGENDQLPNNTVEAAMQVLQFVERYDRVGFGRRMRDGFALKQQLVQDATSLVKTGVFAGVQHILNSLDPANVSHVILSSERDFVAVVLREAPCRIRIYRRSADSREPSSHDFTEWKQAPLADLTAADAAEDGVFGVFYSNSERKMLAVAVPQHRSVCITRVGLARLEEPVTQWIESRSAAPLRRMKPTEDAAKAFALFEDWEFLVLGLDDGIRIVNRGRLHYPCGIDFFVGFFIDSSFIHLSEDAKRLSAGWDSSRSRLVSFLLNCSREDMIADYVRNCAHLQGSNFEQVIWMNRDNTRAMVNRNESGLNHLVIYDISQRPHQEKHTFAVTSEPCGPGEWRYGRPSYPPWNRVSQNGHLHALQTRVLLNLQLSVPDAALFDLIGAEIDEGITKRLISEFGRSLFAQPRGQQTLLHHTVMRKRHDCARMLLDFASEEGVTVSLCWNGGDLLGWAIIQESRESVEFVMETLARRCTTVSEMASILSVHLDRLLELFPKLLSDYLVDDKLCFEYGRFPVPLSLLKNWEERPMAMVTAPMSNWTASNSEETRALWTDNEKSFKEELEKRESEVHAMAVSKFVCLEEMVYQGNGNFIERLNRDTVPVNIFSATFVRALVQWRWQTSLRKGFLISAVLHVIAAVSFSVCLANAEILKTVVEGTCDSDGCFLVKERPFIRLTAAIAVFLVIYLTVFGIIPPIRIVSLFTVPAILLYLIFTGEHPRIEASAVIAAVECMSFWSCILFYLQPLSATGPLVSMIRYVFRDIMAFAILHLLVVVGFGFSFLIMFADVFEVEDYGHFSTPLRSFETLFYAALGEFDSEPFRTTGHILGVCRSLLFDSYLVVANIVMLSLLISILGDTYDRVKLTEDAELIKCRAKLVAIGYGWNGIPGKIIKRSMRWMLAARDSDLLARGPGCMRHVSGITVQPLQRCFHFLVPAESIDADRTATWHGKILELVRMVRSELRKNEQQSANRWQAMETEVREMRKEITVLKEKPNQNDHSMAKLRDTLDKMLQRFSQER